MGVDRNPVEYIGGEGKDRSKNPGTDSSLGLDWGIFSQLKILNREYDTISSVRTVK